MASAITILFDALTRGGGLLRPRRPAGRPHSRCAFTLIELLVVIAVIAVLISILLPAMTKAKKYARTVVCMSNMRQMGIALSAYLDQNDQKLPPSSCHVSDPEQYWLRLLARYAGLKRCWRCPADEAENFIDWDSPLDEQDIQNARWSSFALNALLDQKCQRYKGLYANAKFVKRPASCIYIGESPSSWTHYDHVHPENWGYSIEAAQGQIAWDRHGKRSTYLFVDCHADILPIEETYSWPGQCLWFPDTAPAWPDDD